MVSTLAISRATGDADMNHIRALFGEYEAWLGIDLCFQGFAEELAGLPGRYAPPAGCLLLARADGDVVGGVGMWRLGADLCEMKRLFVRPAGRGQGWGRRLAEAVVEAAVAAGYARMRLDTFTRLEAAVALYRSMGFREIDAYYDNPLADVLYMEMDLAVCG